MLGWADEALRADRDLVLAAARQNGAALRWAPDELRDDFEAADVWRATFPRRPGILDPLAIGGLVGAAGIATPEPIGTPGP